MQSSSIGRALWKASREKEFLRRFLGNMGSALAEEGLVLTDEEMMILRDHKEEWQGLPERAARDRITAIARSHYRE
ncbi:MAG: hypothetical protein H7308_03135 [Chthonomonadaceae bacterium]|nr:hypothetical protein [Chthonomonadaceae bacterium]